MSSGNWKYTFRPILVVPEDAPIFEACETGSIDDIIGILNQGSASLHNVLPNGRTLLHVRLYGCIFAFCPIISHWRMSIADTDVY